MCTITVVNKFHKEFPLIIAANRDEDYDRPSSDVQVLSREPHLIIGGKDELKGGTWLGVNKYSIFVGLTNQGEKNTKLQSRGTIVLNALKCKSIEEILSFVEDINPSLHNGFNLVFGNQKVVFIAHSYLIHSMVIRELTPGIHIITNDMKFNGENQRAQYIHRKLGMIPGPGTAHDGGEAIQRGRDMPWLDYYKLLKKILANYEYGVRVKPRIKEKKLYGYCTRSSSILAFSEEGLVRYKFHDRTRPKQKRQEGEPFIPKYKDYIDIWRDGVSSLTENNEEKDDTEDDDSAESPKDMIMKLIVDRNWKLKLPKE